MNNYERLSRKAPENDRVGAQLMADFAKALHRRGLLSKEWAKESTIVSRRPEVVKSPLSAETQKLVEHLKKMDILYTILLVKLQPL